MAQIEQWDPNIKAKKYQRGGAYTNPQMPQQADWAQVNKAIQESVKFMGDALGKAAAIDAQFMKVWEDKGAEFEKGIGNLQEGGNAAMEGVVDEIVDVVAADTNKANRIRERRDKRAAAGKDTSRLDRRLSKQEAKEYHQLSRADKKRAIEKLDQVQALKSNIEKVVTDLAKGDPNNINWHGFANNPKVKDFFNHVLTGKALEGENLFSIDVSGNSPKIVWNVPSESVGWGTLGDVELTPEEIEKIKNNDPGFTKQLTPEQIEKIKNTDPGFTKEITLQELTSGSSLFEDATEDKDAIIGLLDKAGEEGIKLRKSQHTGPDAQTGGATWDEETWKREQKDLIRSTDKSNYGFIFNNMTHTINPANRMTAYDPNNEQHVADVEKWIDNYLDNKLGEAPPVRQSQAEFESDKQARMGNVYMSGVGYVPADAVDKAEGLVKDVVMPMSKDPEGKLYADGLPKSDDYSEVQKDATEAGLALKGAVEGSRGWWSKTFNSGQDVLNETIKEYNENGLTNLNTDQRNIISKYKAYIGGFDETVDLNPYLADQGVVNPVYNRVDKTVTYEDKSGNEITLDLSTDAGFNEFSYLMMKATGLDQTTGGKILKNIFQSQGGEFNKFVDPDRPAPPSTIEELEEVENQDITDIDDEYSDMSYSDVNRSYNRLTRDEKIAYNKFAKPFRQKKPRPSETDIRRNYLRSLNK
jgi:hypothetical protein